MLLQPRQNLLAAASKVGEASQDVMKGVGETDEELDKAFQVRHQGKQSPCFWGDACSALSSPHTCNYTCSTYIWFRFFFSTDSE